MTGTAFWYTPPVPGASSILVALCQRCIEVLPFSRALHERAEFRVLLRA